MAEFARTTREADQPASTRPARTRVCTDRRPPQKQRVASSRRVSTAKIKADERRKIWEEEAVLFFFFALLVDA